MTGVPEVVVRIDDGTVGIDDVFGDLGEPFGSHGHGFLGFGLTCEKIVSHDFLLFTAHGRSFLLLLTNKVQLRRGFCRRTPDKPKPAIYLQTSKPKFPAVNGKGLLEAIVILNYTSYSNAVTSRYSKSNLGSLILFASENAS